MNKKITKITVLCLFIVCIFSIAIGCDMLQENPQSDALNSTVSKKSLDNNDNKMQTNISTEVDETGNQGVSISIKSENNDETGIMVSIKDTSAENNDEDATYYLDGDAVYYSIAGENEEKDELAYFSIT